MAGPTSRLKPEAGPAPPSSGYLSPIAKRGASPLRVRPQFSPDRLPIQTDELQLGWYDSHGTLARQPHVPSKHPRANLDTQVRAALTQRYRTLRECTHESNRLTEHPPRAWS